MKKVEEEQKDNTTLLRTKQSYRQPVNPITGTAQEWRDP